jgi:ribonuclease HII
MPPDYKYELKAQASGVKLVAGIDEAGRGPLAGPVVAAAVILGPNSAIQGLNDSKLLTPNQREKLFTEINAEALAINFSIVTAETIDRINILQATKLAMTQAVLGLEPQPELLLIDGPINLQIEIPQIPIIKGDQLSLSIAAASVIAKVTRDRIMEELHSRFPQYRFDRNKGYGTKEHVSAIRKHGPCVEHRKYFGVVKMFCQEELFRD